MRYAVHAERGTKGKPARLNIQVLANEVASHAEGEGGLCLFPGSRLRSFFHLGIKGLIFRGAKGGRDIT
jgi:hypothetical protein